MCELMMESLLEVRQIRSEENCRCAREGDSSPPSRRSPAGESRQPRGVVDQNQEERRWGTATEPRPQPRALRTFRQCHCQGLAGR
jgi:hypothetical protein